MQKLSQKAYDTVEKYRLQNLASRIAWQQGKKAGLQFPANFHKVSKCRVTRYDENVSVLRSKEHGSTHFGGVIVCARAWVCPVCAPLMQAKRAERVIKTFQWAYDPSQREQAVELAQAEYDRRSFEDEQFLSGEISKKKRRQHMPSPSLLSSKLKVVMLTLTTPHSRDDTTVSLFEDFVLASQELRSGRKWNDFKKTVGLVGEVIATEITFGKNGPHIHRHILMIVKDQDDEKTESFFTSFFQKNWGNSLRKIGLLSDDDNSSQYKSFLKYGVDVIARATDSDYLSKQGREKTWGADAEIAKQAKKKAGKDSRTPFEVLSDSERDPASARIYADYMIGTKGRAQLTWSRGFKALIGLDDLDDEAQDEQDASESDDPADLLASLGSEDWKLIVSHKQRGNLLAVAYDEGLVGIQKLIAKLKLLGNTDRDPANIPVLFDLYFDKLLEKFHENPIANIDPNFAKRGESERNFVLDSYAHELMQIHANL